MNLYSTSEVFKINNKLFGYDTYKQYDLFCRLNKHRITNKPIWIYYDKNSYSNKKIYILAVVNENDPHIVYMYKLKGRRWCYAVDPFELLLFYQERELLYFTKHTIAKRRKE